MKFSDLPKHHAILMEESEREAVGLALWNELRTLSPVNRFFDQTVLDIETARSLITWGQTPYNDEKVALVSFSTATLPAQNAMLKILEEPVKGVRFILLTSNSSSLLPTVLSRVYEMRMKHEEPGIKHEVFAEEFLNTPHALRIKLPYIVNLLSLVDEEGRKDRESIRAFILSLAEVLRNNQSSSHYISETLQVASYASDPSASGKALIEYMSLLLPQVKA